jgi:hypothetical protein
MMLEIGGWTLRRPVRMVIVGQTFLSVCSRRISALPAPAQLVSQTLRELRVEQHPQKTFIGRIERGFTFLGYWITKRGVTGVVPSAWQAFRGRERQPRPASGQATLRSAQDLREWLCHQAGFASRMHPERLGAHWAIRSALEAVGAQRCAGCDSVGSHLL